MLHPDGRYSYWNVTKQANSGITFMLLPPWALPWRLLHYNDVIMSVMASQITSLTIVYSTVYSGAAQRKHQSSASLAFVRGIHRWPVNSPHKGPVTRKVFPFDDVIMYYSHGLFHNDCYGAAQLCCLMFANNPYIATGTYTQPCGNGLSFVVIALNGEYQLLSCRNMTVRWR